MEKELQGLDYFEKHYSGFRGANDEYVDLQPEGIAYNDGERIREINYRNWTQILDDVEENEGLSESAKLLIKARNSRGMEFVHRNGSK